MYRTQTMAPLVQLAEELDETRVSPGILGFLVFALLGGAVWLLAKSLNRHIKRVDFDEDPDSSETAGEGKPSAQDGAEPERAERVSPPGGSSTSGG